MARSDDPRCNFFLSVDPRSLADTRAEMTIDNMLETCCEVIRQPDCCILCAENDDCARLPMHWNCRCKPSMYFKMFGAFTAGGAG